MKAIAYKDVNGSIIHTPGHGIHTLSLSVQTAKNIFLEAGGNVEAFERKAMEATAIATAGAVLT